MWQLVGPWGGVRHLGMASGPSRRFGLGPFDLGLVASHEMGDLITQVSGALLCGRDSDVRQAEALLQQAVDILRGGAHQDPTGNNEQRAVLKCVGADSGAGAYA